MHGIYYVIKPLFAFLLLLFTAAALYMGVFKAQRPDTSFTKKIITGICSGSISAVSWFFMYSHYYMGW